MIKCLPRAPASKVRRRKRRAIGMMGRRKFFNQIVDYFGEQLHRVGGKGGGGKKRKER